MEHLNVKHNVFSLYVFFLEILSSQLYKLHIYPLGDIQEL